MAAERRRDPATLQVILDRSGSMANGQLLAALQAIVPGEGVIVDERERTAYETDGLTAYKQPPLLVVLPETTEQVSRVLRYCQEE